MKPTELMWTFSVMAFCGLPGAALSQGQDSTEAARQIQTLAALLPGFYDNANQAYFDGRLQRPERHSGIHIRIERIEGSTDPVAFVLSEYQGQERARPARQRWLGLRLSDDERQIWMDVGDVDAVDAARLERGEPPRAQRTVNGCSYRFQRRGEQFEGERAQGCAAIDIEAWLLSERQLWLTGLRPSSQAATESPYRLHRARPFSCYVDMPGVGGGRDEPFERYDGFEIHDQGGSFWFTTRGAEQRRLGITLLNVDWPMNNYEGAFARDSLVIYVNESIDGKSTEHGYSFTTPAADRVGINLKWLLAYCFMDSNTDAKPSLRGY